MENEFFFLSSSTEKLIQHGGFALITLLVFVETGLLLGFIIPGGESLLFTAGLLAGAQTLDVNIEVMIPVLIVAAFAGDFVGYHLGKKMGNGLYEKEDTFYFKKKYLYNAEHFYKKHGAMALILGRFVPVVRTFNPFISGATELKMYKFLLLSFTGCVLWVGSLVGASYFLGKQFPQVKDYMGYIIPAVVAVALLPLIRTIIKEARSGKNSS